MSAPWLSTALTPPRMASQEDMMRHRIAGAPLRDPAPTFEAADFGHRTSRSPGVTMRGAAEGGWSPSDPAPFVERRAVPRQCGVEHAGGVA